MIEPAPDVFAPATAADRPAVLELLRACALPTGDLPAELDHFFVARSRDALVGVVGLQVFGAVGLLRSLAVAPAQRGQRLASAPWRLARDEARAAGVRQLLLLTTTAEGIFARWGFARISREATPEAIRGTPEFQGLCPSTAAVMRLAV